MLFDRVAGDKDEAKGGHCNKTQHEVLKNDGDPRYIHQMARVTMPAFRLAAKEAGWSERRQFLNFYNHILMQGTARDLWLEAIEMGLGKDKPPINTDAPNEGDFKQVVTNYFGLVVAV